MTFPLTSEIEHEDRSDGVVSETIDERTQASGKDDNTKINNNPDAHNYDTVHSFVNKDKYWVMYS